MILRKPAFITQLDKFLLRAFRDRITRGSFLAFFVSYLSGSIDPVVPRGFSGCPGLGIFNTEASRLAVIRLDLEKKSGELYQFYKNEDKIAHDTMKEIEGCISSNPEYLELKAKEIKQAAIVDYLEGTLNNIKQLSYSLKNFVEYQKIQLGMGTL